VLDMDSSESPTYGEQEGSAYNGHFGCTCFKGALEMASGKALPIISAISVASRLKSVGRRTCGSR
jgi:hypothetical protein